MLPAEITNCIRESIDAELPPRDKDVRLALQASQRRLASQGLSRSGNLLYERAQIGCEELTVRAEIIWGQIKRCHLAFRTAAGEQHAGELQQQISEHVTAQCAVVFALVDINPQSAWPRGAQDGIRDALTTRRSELIRKYTNEVRFHIQSAAQIPKSEPGTFSFYGPVGAVQTGANAIAHIHIDAGGAARLAQALEQLQAAIRQAVEMPAEQRADSQDLVHDLIAAASAPKPNGPKLVGLLNGLAVTVQTVASLRGAWDLVRDAARLMGVPVP